MKKRATPSLLFNFTRPVFVVIAFPLLLALFPVVASAGIASITAQVDQPGIPVAPTMHGLFFEDINYAADGGLYAELVQNRSFEHREATYAWTQVTRGDAEGRFTVASDVPLNTNNQHFLRLEVGKAGTGGIGAVNSGYDGIVLRAGENYRFSIYARRPTGKQAALKIQLEDANGRVLAGERIAEIGADWKKHELNFKSPVDESKGRLVVLATEIGAVDVDMVSLFPVKTFNGRSNGLRADLAQVLADMKPGFLRFPGGCVVEGSSPANMYRWKDTIGDVAERKQNSNLWANDASPQYSQTYGLGFFEFFQFCEDIGAAPLPVLNCGMSCQARRGEAIPLDQLAPYVQDALDLIEFANGSITSEWGAKRAAMGHPKPFNLKYLAVGNEQWLQEYFDRYDIFYKALKAKYPEIQLISSAGPQPEDGFWKFAWGKFKTGTPADIVDEHYYRPPQWFLQFNDRYDSYDRKGPKIFVGEYAAHDATRRNNLRAAIAEASYSTGLWRNAEVVVMASYAPLLSNINHVQWGPDLIWFDNQRVVRTPSYHVQALLAQNCPDVVVPLQIEAAVVTPPAFTGRIGFGTTQCQAEFKDVTVTKDGQTLFQSDFSKTAEGWHTRGGTWAVKDGAYQQTSEVGDGCVYIGDSAWNSYTLSLKARKIAGRDGFLINFAVQDGLEMTWRIGFEGNSQDRLEIPGATDPYVPGHIEEGRWHDIRVELKGATVKCFQDGQLIQEADCKPTRSLYAAAGRKTKSGEVIVAVANPTGTPQAVRINLAGVKNTKLAARVTVLTSASPEDENTFEAPNLVQPREESVMLNGSLFERTVPAWSFTVLKITP